MNSLRGGPETYENPISPMPMATFKTCSVNLRQKFHRQKFRVLIHGARSITAIMYTMNPERFHMCVKFLPCGVCKEHLPRSIRAIEFLFLYILALNIDAICIWFVVVHKGPILHKERIPTESICTEFLVLLIGSSTARRICRHKELRLEAWSSTDNPVAGGIDHL